MRFLAKRFVLVMVLALIAGQGMQAAFVGCEWLSVPGGGRQRVCDDVTAAWKQGDPAMVRGLFAEGPAGRWWLLSIGIPEPWKAFDAKPVDPKAELATEIYGARPAMGPKFHGKDGNARWQAAKIKWDQDQGFLVALGLPPTLDARTVPGVGDPKSTPPILLARVVLENAEETAQAWGLGEPLYYSRVNRRVSPEVLSDEDIDREVDPRFDHFSPEGNVEYVVRFRSPMVGGPVQFRVSQMVTAMHLMIAGWQAKLERSGIPLPIRRHPFLLGK